MKTSQRSQIIQTYPILNKFQSITFLKKGGTGICFVPLNRDLKEHLHVYKNFETGKCTEEDEKEYLNLHTPYRVGYVMTFCETIEEFMKKEFKKIEKIANERLTKMNKTT